MLRWSTTTQKLAKTFIPATQNQFFQENIFNKSAPVRWSAIAMNTNFAFTG